MSEELTPQEIGVLLRFVARKLRYERKRNFTDPGIGEYKLNGLEVIYEKLERMKLAS